MRVPLNVDRKARLSIRLRATWALAVAFVFSPVSYGQRGAQTAPANLEQLVHTATTILRGNVVSAKIEPHPQFANLQTVVVTISVGKVLKGETGGTYTFRQFIWDARDASDTAGYRKAGEVLLFLNRVSSYGLTSPVGLDQGRFLVMRDAKGEAFALNGRHNSGLFDQVASHAASRGIVLSRQAQAMMAKPGGQVMLGALEDAIGALVGAGE